MFANIFNAAIPFALLPVLTRYLSPEEYGEVAMFQTLIGALAAFVGLSLHGAAGRKFYDGDLGKRDLAEFISSCLQILLFSSIFSIIILALFSSHLSDWLGLAPQWIFFAVLVTASNAVVQLLLGQWQVRRKAMQFGALQMSRSLLNVILSLAFVIALHKGADGRISAQIWTAAIFAVMALWLLKAGHLLNYRVWRPDFIREALRFGVPLIPHVGGAFLLASVDRFVINTELGIAQVGVYMVAVQFAGALALIFDGVNKAYVPWLFERLKRNQSNEKRKIVRYTYAWFGLILGGAALSFLVGPWLIILVAGENYAGAGELIGWMALGQVFGGMYLMVTNYIFFSKRTGLLSFVTILSGMINVVLLFYLIDLFGLKGAAYSFCVAMLIRFLLTWMVAQKRHPMPWLKFK